MGNTPTTPGTFYRWFSERRLTRFGASRRERIQRARLTTLHRHAQPPGDLLEIGPGHGSMAQAATAAGWRYRCIEASPALAAELRAQGHHVIESWAPPLAVDDQSCDVVYADQVLEHMSGIEAAREFAAECLRALRPGGVLFVVVPNYLKERQFFWDVDYTHNFVTTDRRVRQLLYDEGFNVERSLRRIGATVGVSRDLLLALSLLFKLPGVDALSRYTNTEELLFKIRKNFFETISMVARKPSS